MPAKEKRTASLKENMRSRLGSVLCAGTSLHRVIPGNASALLARARRLGAKVWRSRYVFRGGLLSAIKAVYSKSFTKQNKYRQAMGKKLRRGLFLVDRLSTSTLFPSISMPRGVFSRRFQPYSGRQLGSLGFF